MRNQITSLIFTSWKHPTAHWVLLNLRSDYAKNTVKDKSDRPLWIFHANLNRNRGIENTVIFLEFSIWYGWYSTFLVESGCVLRKRRNMSTGFTFYWYSYTPVYEHISAALNQTLKSPSDTGGFSSMICFFVPDWSKKKKKADWNAALCKPYIPSWLILQDSRTLCRV